MMNIQYNCMMLSGVLERRGRHARFEIEPGFYSPLDLVKR